MIRKSQEDIENSFNCINLNYILLDDDPLSLWLEEGESPLLDDLQNSQWLFRLDSDDENVGADDNGSNFSETPISGDGGLGSLNDGGDGDRGANESIYQERDEQKLYNFSNETSHFRDNDFYVEMTDF